MNLTIVSINSYCSKLCDKETPNNGQEIFFLKVGIWFFGKTVDIQRMRQLFIKH